MIARFGKMAGGFGFAALLFAPRGGAGKLAGDVDEFLNAPANFLQIILHAGTAIAKNLSGSPLIPVDAAGLNHLI